MKIRDKKKFIKSTTILIFMIIIISCSILLFIEFLSYPEKYLTTWKYKLKQDIEAGNQQAIEYYQNNYLEKGQKLWEYYRKGENKMLSEEILEKIKEIYGLLCQINNYWTRLEFWKSKQDSCKSYIFELDLDIYTIIEETGKEEKKVNHILREGIDLNETTAIIKLEKIIEKIKELIHATNEND